MERKEESLIKILLIVCPKLQQSCTCHRNKLILIYMLRNNMTEWAIYRQHDYYIFLFLSTTVL